MRNSNGQYCSTHQTCKLLGISRDFLFRLSLLQDFPPEAQIKRGRRYQWAVKLVAQYLDMLIDKE